MWGVCSSIYYYIYSDYIGPDYIVSYYIDSYKGSPYYVGTYYVVGFYFLILAKGGVLFFNSSSIYFIYCSDISL